jgi:Na+/phosphate symporter
MSTASIGIQQERFAFLRRVLLADGIVSGSFAILLAIGGGLLSEPLGLSSLFIRVVGLSLVPFAGALFYLSTRAHLPQPMVWAIVGLNAVWALASVGLFFSGWVAPTALGTGFIIAQAALVAVFAELQFIGLRRAA